MSLETWKAEFYPIDADKTDKKDAIDHSLQKWLGLLPENLERHNVQLMLGAVCDMDADEYQPGGVEITGGTCALCHHYLDDDWDEERGHDSACHPCPLYQARGGFGCDVETDDEHANNEDAPWQEFSKYNHVTPMIRWLQITKEKTNA